MTAVCLGSGERAIFLEDDVDLSPYAYKWLKAAIQHFEPDKSLAGSYIITNNHDAISLKEVDLWHMIVIPFKLSSKFFIH